MDACQQLINRYGPIVDIAAWASILILRSPEQLLEEYLGTEKPPYYSLLRRYLAEPGRRRLAFLYSMLSLYQQ
ncbi:MAG: hypothetical protein QNJ46_06975 [Leptolyngbyaceae cyanobacterium MO_188.B28]|nr:hypothetical protein [Leptolyngbyaceae cyanobacterium MO_188.B28]